MERDKQQTSESGMEVKGLDLQGTSNGQGYRDQKRTADMELGKKISHPQRVDSAKLWVKKPGPKGRITLLFQWE